MATYEIFKVNLKKKNLCGQGRAFRALRGSLRSNGQKGQRAVLKI